MLSGRAFEEEILLDKDSLFLDYSRPEQNSPPESLAAITTFTMTLWLKVRGVLKDSGNSDFDGQCFFFILDQVELRKLGLKILTLL